MSKDELPSASEIPDSAEAGMSVPGESGPSADVSQDEDSMLALLQKPDLSPVLIEQLSRNAAASKSRKVRLAIASHAKTPRHVSLPLIRPLFTFDLMKLALMPTVAADIKRVAEETLINRLESVTAGERISLARRASGRVAGALLRDSDARIAETALANKRLTESVVVQSISRPGAAAETIALICHSAKWSCRAEVRMALLRNEYTPLAEAIEFARLLDAAQLREVLAGSRLPRERIQCLLQQAVEGVEPDSIADKV